MEWVHFLNVEYFLVRTYQLALGFNTESLQDVPGHIATFAGRAAYVGLGLALLLLILAVWANIRLIVVEHEGFHKKDEEERERRAQEHTEGVGTNGRWDRIVSLTNTSSESDWRRAIIEADTMLGDILTEQGYTGEGVGEQLRGANPLQFTTLDLAWQAHKVRNDIAHGGEQFHLSERDARATVDYYRRVFEEFGVI